MNEQVHIMTDIETLGVKEGATIFQIAAASFNIETGEVISSIDLKLNIEKVKQLEVDGSTLNWWLATDKELLAKLLREGTLSEKEMMTQFIDWVKEQGPIEDVTLWGNGILFDNLKLKKKLESMDLVYPIHYQNDRDVRTILALAMQKTGLSKDELSARVSSDEEVKHDALDDTNYQIRLIVECHRLLMKDSKYVF